MERSARFSVGVLALLGCGSGITPPPPADCSNPATVTLAPGQHMVYDPAASTGCFRFPAASELTEYLLAVVSGAGKETADGIRGPYYLQAVVGGVTAAPTSEPALAQARPTRGPSAQQLFDLSLRTRERELSSRAGLRLAAPSAALLAAPPVVGSERDFSVCKTLSCTQFDTVTATAEYVSASVAVYSDNADPFGVEPLQLADFEDMGETFDQYFQAIATNAFGAYSDLDGNGLVLVLLTKAVNALIPNCVNGRVEGFFWGGDLLDIDGSNHGEIFYGMVPSSATSGGCRRIERAEAVGRLKPTMIHELQHMISWNQHVTVRKGLSEETWLNEALSAVSEELAGRLIPDAECAPQFSSCRSQYSSGNLFNAYDYLDATEANFLVFGGNSHGTLEERGAGWLFVRWLVDQFGTGQEGENITRALVQTKRLGFENVEAVTALKLPSLVAESFLAVYVDDLPNFTPLSPRMTLTSWGLRQVFMDNCCTPAPGKELSQPWPVDAPVIDGASSFIGTLRAGSGRHFRVVRPPGGEEMHLILAANVMLDGLDPALSARLGIVRVR